MDAGDIKRCSVYLDPDPLIKPPCIRCGKESEGWLDNDGDVVRVCRECGEWLQELCEEYQDRQLCCSMASGAQYTQYIFLFGEWISESEMEANERFLREIAND